ncbi:hypothetical protein [Burkholderia sp. Bp9142]|uniref:hypothetical protein n=1 Tax=Burkholderia sp. Bp9142 TaxID=2184573 RepID=UPI000F5AFE2A|nr:hypothetical protein [Burkholderia sp. Bp9142]RQR34829.1 hypothetical protein DIE22_16205 [Burkholderia sp. Bp9142]
MLSLNRKDYLNDEHVRGFIAWLSHVISGTKSINFTVGFATNQLPPDFKQRFPHGYGDRRPSSATPVYVVHARTLEDLFSMYWWKKEGFDINKARLDEVSAAIAISMAGEEGEAARSLAEHACQHVMEWGFGKDRRAYKANMAWANRQGTALVSVLREGREALTCDCPNIDVFAMTGGPRMNAGWTKYYALAVTGHIIYDGRVGAALGFLVRRYIETLPESMQPERVPDRLGFLWGDGDGGGKSRNPSAGRYQFGKLYGGHYGSKAWARVNVQANWVLTEALLTAKAHWCSGSDGLRRLEAALFMLGYDFTPYADSHPMDVAA